MIVFIFKLIFWFIGFFSISLLCIGIYHDRMSELENLFIKKQIDYVLYTIKAKNVFQFLCIMFIMLLSVLSYFITQLNFN